MKRELNTKKFFNLLAFVALIISGISLLISKIFFNSNGTVSAVLNNIAYILAFVVVAFAAFNFVKVKRNLAITIIYIIAVLIVVVPLVLSMFNV